MAKLVAKAATDMTAWEDQLTDASEADVADHDDQHFVANSDKHTFVGTGENLSYDSLGGRTVPTGGTIHSLTVSIKHGAQLFAITDASFQADDFTSNAATDDWDSIEQTIFRGNDQLIGSKFSDHLLAFDGNDSMNGRGGDDSLRGGTGKDTLTGGGGEDRFVYHNAGESSGRANHDTITDLNANKDFVAVTFAVTQVESEIHNATVSNANFDSDLATATAGLASHHAVLVEVDNTGPNANHLFLVVNADGTAGYQAGHDLVIDVTGMTGNLTTHSFENI